MIRHIALSNFAGPMHFAVFTVLGVLVDTGDLATAFAADTAKQPASNSLDDELLKSLNNDLLDDIDDLPAVKPKPNRTEDSAGDIAEESQTPPIDGEDLGQPGEDHDPYHRIARRMRQTGSRLARDQSGADTQRMQQEIVDELAALVEQLKKECQGGQCDSAGQPQDSQRSKPGQASKPGGAKPGDTPARDSTAQLRRDATAKADPEAIRQNMKNAWGNLPQQLREQIMQSPVEEFLPKYERMIEQYFKRLAEEDSRHDRDGAQ